MGLGALFAGGVPKLRPVGSSAADRCSPGESFCITLIFVGNDFMSLNCQACFSDYYISEY